MLTALDLFLRNNNRYANEFRQMYELLFESERDARAADLEFVQPRMYLVHRPNEHRGRYNEPVKVADMAVVFSGEEGLPPAPGSLRVYPTNDKNHLHEIGACNYNRDPMVYPLIFPYGEFGKKSSIYNSFF